MQIRGLGALAMLSLSQLKQHRRLGFLISFYFQIQLSPGSELFFKWCNLYFFYSSIVFVVAGPVSCAGFVSGNITPFFCMSNCIGRFKIILSSANCTLSFFFDVLS